MESLELIIVYYIAYVLMFLYSIMFITTSLPNFCRGLMKKKVTFKEPKCVTNPNIGQHAYLELAHQDLKIHYVFNGEKGKPLMLFLHGFPEFWYSWKFQLPEFGKDYFAVAIDMVGYGKSSKPHGVQNYKPQRIATCIKDFVHELGYGDCVLVGHDWGTLIAYQVAADYPDIVKKLIVMNGYPIDYAVRKKIHQRQPRYLFTSAYMFFFQIPYFPELILSSANFAMFEMFKKGKGKVQTADNITDEDIMAYKYQFQQGGFTAPLNYYRNLFTWETMNFKPKFYDMQSFIIWGTADPFIPVEAAAISASVMSNGRVHYIDGASHWVNIDKPDEVNRAMRAFLEVT